jgi:hypothetical protein
MRHHESNRVYYSFVRRDNSRGLNIRANFTGAGQ